MKSSGPPKCHPDRQYFAKGMCKKCYTKEYENKRASTPGFKEAKNKYAAARREKCYKELMNTHYQKNYGISFEQYQEMYSVQNGRCAICEQKFDILCVDHNHDTGKVRGLLCRGCNLILGHIDNPVMVANLLNYLALN
jgi:hypothetical protein